MSYTKIEQNRKATYNDLITKLKKAPHRVALPRPTGWGKTWLATELISSGKYKSIVYVYPAEVIRQTVVDRYYHDYDDETKATRSALKEISGVTMLTYAKLSRMSKEEANEFHFDLIIFDECHRMASIKALPNIQTIFNNNRKSHVVGMTATPNRTDGYDVIESLFNGVTVFPYTLHDAFRDGVYKVPYYCFLHHDESSIEDELQEAAFMAGEDIDNLRVQKVLKKKAIEICSIYSLTGAIKDTCTRYVDTNYMKFICFFPTHKLLLEKSEVIKQWLKAAFSEHTIQTLEISTRDTDIAKNVDKLKLLTKRDKGIDLILCVDMLNMGYHVGDITGIFMYRATTSDIIYPQEYGRLLSSGSEEEHIVFDIVDNLHRNGIYDDSTRRRQKNPKKGSNGGAKGKEGGNTITIFGGNGSTPTHGPEGGDYVDPPIDGTPIDPPEGPWWKDVSTLTNTELKLAQYEATYREQIAKLVAEPMHMRCREAFEAHFRRWCKTNNIPYPITDKELKKVYGYSQQDFVNYFSECVKKNQIDYPMRDAEKLLEIGRRRKDGLPMEVFAKWKNVSIESILDLLGVA